MGHLNQPASSNFRNIFSDGYACLPHFKTEMANPGFFVVNQPVRNYGLESLDLVKFDLRLSVKVKWPNLKVTVSLLLLKIKSLTQVFQLQYSAIPRNTEVE